VVSSSRTDDTYLVNALEGHLNVSKGIARTKSANRRRSSGRKTVRVQDAMGDRSEHTRVSRSAGAARIMRRRLTSRKTTMKELRRVVIVMG